MMNRERPAVAQKRSGRALVLVTGDKDGWHDVAIRLKNNRGKVRVRPGYFDPGR